MEVNCWYTGSLSVLFSHTGFLCVDQAGLEPTEIHLPPPLSAEIQGMPHHHPAQLACNVRLIVISPLLVLKILSKLTHVQLFS